MSKKIAFVFPGQGSQSVGMLDAFGDNVAVKSTLDEASAALGEDVAQLIKAGPAEALSLTTNTQPVMLTMVRFRAQAMQEAVPVGTGGMAAILGLDDPTVLKVCADAQAASGEVVEAVNFNAPAQVVIAGSKAGVEKACELAKAAGAKRALPLPVSAPFHSSLLKPASEKLSVYLQDKTFHAPGLTVINNVDVAVVNDPVGIKDALIRQAAAPVRWVETIQEMAKLGVTHIVECGPGKVLAGLTKRIDPNLVGLSITDPASIDQVMAELA